MRDTYRIKITKCFIIVSFKYEIALLDESHCCQDGGRYSVDVMAICKVIQSQLDRVTRWRVLVHR